MKKTKIIIFAPSYDENIGGIIVLHHLCHLINKSELNVEAYIKPSFNNYMMTGDFIKDIKSYLKIVWRKVLNKYYFKNKKEFNTPLYNKNKISDEDIVIYSEMVLGNPLKAKNVVRWLLHKPGYHSGHIYYETGELYFRFQKGLVNNFDLGLSKLSDNSLYTPCFPFEIYNIKNVAEIRMGTAYSIRKGKNKIHDQHPNDAICIDGLSHEDIANIFKKVKRFISYDIYSGYMTFAVLCGCEVIVIPDEGISKIEWFPDEEKRYGFAYGFDDLEWANKTRELRLPYMKSINVDVQKNVDDCLVEMLDFFSIKNDKKL
ncbi:WavQ [Photobacterium phosphoreum]|uniref:WavQ n=1 Tax=Photobacterium phosphoreum TaxID=659 RepID=UPI00242D3B11|nr:WavQ [Photobacterium phosphoreum]